MPNQLNNLISKLKTWLSKSSPRALAKKSSCKPSPQALAKPSSWGVFNKTYTAVVLAAALLTTTVLIVRCEGDNVNGPKLLSRTQASLRIRPSADLGGDPNRFASYKQLPHIFIQKPTDQQIPLAHMQLPCPASGGSSSGGAQGAAASNSRTFDMNLCVFDDKDETFLDGFLTGRGVDIALSGAGSFPPIYFADAEHDDYGGSLVYSEVVLGQGGETLQGFSPERKGEWMSDFGYLPARKPGNAAANQCLYYEAGSGGEGVEKPSPFPHQCPSSIGLRYAHSHVFNAAAFFDDLPNGQNIQNMRLTAYSENALVFSVLLDAHRRITLIPRHIGVGQLVLKATPIGVGGLPHLRKIQVGVVPFQQARARVHPRDTAVSPTPEAGSHLAWEALLHGPEKMLRGNIAEYRMMMHEGHPKSTTGDNSTFITQVQSLFCPSIPKAESGCTSSLSGDSCTQAGGQTTSGGEGQTCQCPQASGPTCTGHLAGFLPVYTFWNDGDSRGDSDRAWHYRRNSSAARNYGGVVANLIEGYIGVYGQPRRAVGAQSSEALSSKFVVLDSRAPRSQRANSGPQVVSYTQSSQSQGRFTCPDRAVCWASQNDLRHEGCDSDFCVFTTPGPKEILQGAATGGAATGGVATGGTATSAAGGTTEESLPVIRQASHSLAYSLPRGIPTHHTMNIFIPSRDEAEDTPAPNNNGDPFMTLYVGFEPQGYSPASVQANSIKPGVSTAERPFVPVKIYEQWRDLFSDTACTFEEGRVPEGSDGQCVPHRPGSRTPRDPDCCTPPVDIAFARMEATAADGDTDPTLKNANFSGAMSGAWKCKESRAMGGISGGVGRGASGAGGAGGGGANANAPRYECTELEVAERGAAGAAVWCLPKAVAINASGGVSAAPSELRLPMYAMYGHQGLAVSFKQPGACPQACRGDGASGGPGGPCLQMSGSQALESIRHFADSFTLRVTDAFYNVKDLKIKLKTLAGPDGRDPDDGPTREFRRVLVSLAPVAGVTTRTPAPIMDVPENITQPLKLTLSSPFAEDVRVRFSVNNGGGANAARKCDGSASREGGLQFGDLCTVVGVFSELAEALDCDFEAQAGHLTIPARQTEVELPLCILSDSRVEANENFSVTLSDLRADCGSGRPGCVAFQGRDTQAQPTTITRTINIVNDDQAAASLEIAGIVRASESCNALCSAAAVSGRSSFVPGASICRSYSGSVSEGDKICFKASLSSSFGEQKQVAWHALRKAGQAQHATPGTDFTCSRVSTPDNQGCAMRSTPVPARLTGALTFEAGAREQMFGVAIALDKLSDADESFEVCLGEQTSTSCAAATPQGSSRVRALSFSGHRHTVKIKNVIKMYIAQDCGAPINVLRPIRLSETTHFHRLKLCISNSSLQVTRPFDVRLMSLPFLGSAELSSATPGTDFKPINQSYRFTANNRSGGLGFEINIMDDRISEGPEAFLLRLLPSGGSVSGLASAVGLLSEGLRRRAGWPEGLDVVEETRVVITDNEPPVVRMALLQPLPSGACPQANSPAAMQSVEANTMIEGQNLCVKVFTTQRLLDGDTLRLRLGAYGDDRSDGSNFTADDCNRLGADEICDFSLQAASAVAASGGSSGAIKATSAADITLSADGRCLGGSEPTRSGCESSGSLWVPLPSAQVLRLTTHYDNDDAEANEKLKLFLCPAGDGACSPGAADVAVTRAPGSGAGAGSGSGASSTFKIDSNWNQRSLVIIDGARVGEGIRVNIAGRSTVQEGDELDLTLSLQGISDNPHFRAPIGVCWRATNLDAAGGVDRRTLAQEGLDFYGMTANAEGLQSRVCGGGEEPPCWQPILGADGFATWSNGDYDTRHEIQVHAYADGLREENEKFQIQFKLAQVVGNRIDCTTTDPQSRVGFRDSGAQLFATSRDYSKIITIGGDADLEMKLFAHSLGARTFAAPILLDAASRSQRAVLLSLASPRCRIATESETRQNEEGERGVEYSIEYSHSVQARSGREAEAKCAGSVRLFSSYISTPEGAYACLKVTGRNRGDNFTLSTLTQGGTASESDFVPRRDRVRFPGGEAYYAVKIVKDAEDEECENFRVQFSYPTAEGVKKATALVYIQEDEGAYRARGFDEDIIAEWRFRPSDDLSDVFSSPQTRWNSSPPTSAGRNICSRGLTEDQKFDRTSWCSGLVGNRFISSTLAGDAGDYIEGCRSFEIETRLQQCNSVCQACQQAKYGGRLTQANCSRATYGGVWTNGDCECQASLSLVDLDDSDKITCRDEQACSNVAYTTEQSCARAGAIWEPSFDCYRTEVPVCENRAEYIAWESQRRGEASSGPMIKVTHARAVDSIGGQLSAGWPDRLPCRPDTTSVDVEGPVPEGEYACVTVKLTKPVEQPIKVAWQVNPLSASAGDYDLAAAWPRNPQELKWGCVPTLTSSECTDAGGLYSSGTCDCNRDEALYRTIALKISNDGTTTDECTEDLSIALGAQVTPSGLATVSTENNSARIIIPGSIGAMANVVLHCPETNVDVGASVSCDVKLVDTAVSTKSKILPYPVSVGWQTVDQTAIGNADYTPQKARVSIPAGTSVANLSVQTKPNARYGKNFKVQLLDTRISQVAGSSNACIEKGSPVEKTESTITIAPSLIMTAVGRSYISGDEFLENSCTIKPTQSSGGTPMLSLAALNLDIRECPSVERQSRGDTNVTFDLEYVGYSDTVSLCEQGYYRRSIGSVGAPEGKVACLEITGSNYQDDQNPTLTVELPNSSDYEIDYNQFKWNGQISKITNNVVKKVDEYGNRLNAFYGIKILTDNEAESCERFQVTFKNNKHLYSTSVEAARVTVPIATDADVLKIKSGFESSTTAFWRGDAQSTWPEAQKTQWDDGLVGDKIVEASQSMLSQIQRRIDSGSPSTQSLCDTITSVSSNGSGTCEVFPMLVRLPDNGSKSSVRLRYKVPCGDGSDTGDQCTSLNIPVCTNAQAYNDWDRTGRPTIKVVDVREKERGSCSPNAVATSYSLERDVPEGKVACVTLQLSQAVSEDVSVGWSIDEGSASSGDYDLGSGGVQIVKWWLRECRATDRGEECTKRGGTVNGNTCTCPSSARPPQLLQTIALPIVGNSPNDECPEDLSIVLNPQVEEEGSLVSVSATSNSARVTIPGREDNLIQVSLNCAPWVASTERRAVACTGSGNRWRASSVQSRLYCERGQGVWLPDSAEPYGGVCACALVTADNSLRYLSFPTANECLITKEFVGSGEDQGFDQPIKVEWAYHDGTATRGDYQGQKTIQTIAAGTTAMPVVPITLTSGATEGEYFFVELLRAWRDGDDSGSGQCVTVKPSSPSDSTTLAGQIRNVWGAVDECSWPSNIRPTYKKQPICIGSRTGGGVQTPEVSIELAGYTSGSGAIDKCRTTASRGKCSVGSHATRAACAVASGVWGPDWSGGSQRTDANRDTFAVEESKVACFKVALSRAPSGQAMRLGYNIINGTTVNTDYGRPSDSDAATPATPRNTLNWLAGNNDDKYIAVPISSDANEHCDETFSVALQAAAGATLPAGVTINPTKQSATATIAGQNKATISLTLTQQPRIGGEAIFQAQLNKPVERPVTASWRVQSAAGTAGVCSLPAHTTRADCIGATPTAGVWTPVAAGPLDYNERASGNITIPARSSEAVSFAPVSVYPTATKDKIFYAQFVRNSIDKACVSNVDVPSNTLPSPTPTAPSSTIQAHCIDDRLTNDPNNCHIAQAIIKDVPAKISLASARAQRVSEGADELQIQLQSTKILPRDIEFVVSASRDTISETKDARSPSDFIAPATPWTWTAANLNNTLTIDIKDDREVEGDEVFVVTITPPTSGVDGIQFLDADGNSGATSFKTTVTIADNDAASIKVLSVLALDEGQGNRCDPLQPARDVVQECDGASTSVDACERSGGLWAGACSSTSYTNRANCKAQGETWTRATDGTDHCTCPTGAAAYAANVHEGGYACVRVKLSSPVRAQTQFNIDEDTATISDYAAGSFQTAQARTLRWTCVSSLGASDCREAGGTYSGDTCNCDDTLVKAIKIPINKNQGSTNDECDESFKFVLESASRIGGGTGSNAVSLGDQVEAQIDIPGNTGTRARVALDCPVFAAPPEGAAECGVRIVDHSGTGPGVDNDIVVEWKTFDSTATRGDFVSTGAVRRLIIPRGTTGSSENAISVPITPGATVGQTFFISLLRAWRRGDDPDSTCIQVAGGARVNNAGQTQSGPAGRGASGGTVSPVTGADVSNARCENDPNNPPRGILRSRSLAGGVSTNACQEIVVGGFVTAGSSDGVEVAEGTESPNEVEVPIRAVAFGNQRLYTIPSKTTLTPSSAADANLVGGDGVITEMLNDEDNAVTLRTVNNRRDQSDGEFDIRFVFTADGQVDSLTCTSIRNMYTLGPSRPSWDATNNRCLNIAPRGACREAEGGGCLAGSVVWPATGDWGHFRPLAQSVTVTDDDECEGDFTGDDCTAAGGTVQALRCRRGTVTTDETREDRCTAVGVWAAGPPATCTVTPPDTGIPLLVTGTGLTEPLCEAAGTWRPACNCPAVE